MEEEPLDYQYQSKPLPQPTIIGSQKFSASQSSVDLGPSNPPLPGFLPSPFENSRTPGTFIQGGMGGGGGGALEYITDAVDLVVGTGPSGSTDSTTVNSGATGDNFMYLTTEDLALATNLAILLLGANKLQLSVKDYNDIEAGVSPGDLGVVMLRQLDVCHMGAAGYRSFVCSEAYAP